MLHVCYNRLALFYFTDKCVPMQSDKMFKIAQEGPQCEKEETKEKSLV